MLSPTRVSPTRVFPTRGDATISRVCCAYHQPVCCAYGSNGGSKNQRLFTGIQVQQPEM
jgi:hypothetical protein